MRCHNGNLSLHLRCKNNVFYEIRDTIRCWFKIIQLGWGRFIKDLQRSNSELKRFCSKKRRLLKPFFLFHKLVLKFINWLLSFWNYFFFIINFFINVIIISIKRMQITLPENISHFIFNTVFNIVFYLFFFQFILIWLWFWIDDWMILFFFPSMTFLANHTSWTTSIL